MVNFYRLDAQKQRKIAFRRLLRYIREIVYPYHPAFRKLCQKAAIDPTRIRTYEEFQKIPVMEKAEYRDDPRAYILQPIFPGKESEYPTSPIAKKFLLKYAWQALTNRPFLHTEIFQRQLFREKVVQRACREWLPIHFHASGGSTGNPTPAVYTDYDLRHIIPELSSSIVLRSQKVPDPSLPPFEWSSRRMNIMPGAPHLAFFQALFTKLNIGFSIFDTFGGKVIPTERQIQLFSEGRFSSLAAVPSYLVYWLRKAVEMVEAGKIKPFGEVFQGAAVGAEPVSDVLRAHIHKLVEKLGGHPRFQILETFGMTELRWAGSECLEGTGIHLNPKYYFWELLHPETKQPVAPGEPGILVFSHIGWRGTVFVRYWTGDLVQGGMVHDRCPTCDFSFVRIRGPIMRAVKDFTKIKGSLVPLQMLIATIRDTKGVRNCQVILDKEDPDDKFSRDQMIVRLLPEKEANEEKLREEVTKRVKDDTEVTPDKIIFEHDEEKFEAELFARTGIKAQYVVERRETHI